MPRHPRVCRRRRGPSVGHRGTARSRCGGSGPQTAVAGKARATVTWKTPNGNGATVKAYRVTPYVNGHPVVARVFNSPKTRQLLTGLKPHTRYAFSVTAHNNRGWS